MKTARNIESRKFISINLQQNSLFKIATVCFAVLFFGCQEDFVDVDVPPQLAASDDIFSNLSTANTALAGIYTDFKENPSYGLEDFFSTSVYLAMYSDEVQLLSTLFGQPYIDQSQNFITPETTVVSETWADAYSGIQASNRAIEGISNSLIEESEEKNQLLGEAYFCRALFHFHLVKLYGAIPYLTTSAFEENSVATRTPVTEVYENIVIDLMNARDLMQSEYRTENRVRPNSLAASALLARAYLFMEQWEAAEAESSRVINDPIYTWQSDLNLIFNSDSPSTIWQLDELEPGDNTFHSISFNFAGFGIIPISDETLAAYEPNDLRRLVLTAFAFTSAGDFATNLNKYRVAATTETTLERYKVLRMAEQYLIRAESRARIGDIGGAQADLNMVRTRAGLANTDAANTDELVEAVLQERRIELLGESGHRWFDLVRTGRADAVISQIPSHSDWQATDVLYPIPQSDILLNPNLTQNPGY